MGTDALADSLTRIRNAQRVGHKSVRLKSAKLTGSVLGVLKDEGFISYWEKKPDRNGKFEEIEVGLKYYSSGEPVIGRLDRVSSPGRRVYSNVGELPLVSRGLGISIVSTSQGVISDREARRRKLGGEVLALVS